MITNLLFDFSRVILFSKDTEYKGLMNDLYRKVKEDNGAFLDSFTLNEELLDFLKPFKDKYTLSIYTTDIVQNDPVAKKLLDPIFTHVFSAKGLGISKKTPEGYMVIAEKLHAKPEEILFIDDGVVNVEAAAKAGLQTIQYVSNEQLFQELRKIRV